MIVENDIKLTSAGTRARGIAWRRVLLLLFFVLVGVALAFDIAFLAIVMYALGLI